MCLIGWLVGSFVDLLACLFVGLVVCLFVCVCFGAFDYLFVCF